MRTVTCRIKVVFMSVKSDGGVKKDNSRLNHVPYLIRRGGEVSFAAANDQSRARVDDIEMLGQLR